VNVWTGFNDSGNRDEHQPKPPRPCSPGSAARIFTIVYNIFKGVVSIIAGVVAGSVSWIGFGPLQESSSLCFLTTFLGVQVQPH
jgi:hypothetical protein